MEKRLSIVAVVASVVLLGGALTISGITESTTTDFSPFGSESLPLMGHVTLSVYGPDGIIKQYIQGDNLVVDRGENCIGQAIFGGSFGCNANQGLFNDLAIGTSGATATDGETTLIAQTNTKTDVNIAVTPASGGVAVAIITGTFSDPGIATYREAGLFDSAGNMFARNSFTTVATLTDTQDDLVVQWTINIGS